MTTPLQLAILVAFSAIPVACSTPVIHSPWGKISGVLMEGSGGERIDGYLGVPFALAPTGQRRWEKPAPHPGLENEEVYTADNFKPACQQESPSLLLYGAMSEDCLYLNVFVPAKDERTDELHPVMVWIHGGGFFIGDAPLYQPFKLVTQGDLIVVTIQYRLGALGFLSTGDDTLPGNYGLWDQLMAVKWVKDNIRAFGGDPDMITLFGESAGSMSVGLQAVSSQTKNHFRRIIMQSGSPTVFGKGRWVKEEKTTFSDLVSSLNCQSPDTMKAVDCMRALSADVIANDKGSLANLQTKNPFRINFGPRVDGEFLTRDPAELVADAEYVKTIGLDQVDVLTGFNNNEGALNVQVATMGGGNVSRILTREYIDLLLANSLPYFTSGRHSPVAEQVVHFFYRGTQAFSEAAIDVTTLTFMYADSLFYAPSVQWLRSLVQSQHTGKRYMYLFDHDFEFNRRTIMPGTHHGDELALEFEPKPLINSLFFLLQNKTYNSDDIPALSDMFVNVVTSFARTGNPGQGLMRDLLKGEWPEYRKEDEAYVALTTTPEVRQEIFADRMALWLDLLPLLLKGDSNAQSGSAGSTREEL